MKAGHEESDLKVKPVAAFGLGLAIVVALVLIGTTMMLHPVHQPPAAMRVQPPGPLLQPHPREDLIKLRADEEAALTTYGWADRQAGVVRIPIERAMELTVQRGLSSANPSKEARP